MLDDPVLVVLMVVQAVATLLLTLQVHSLSRRSSAPLLIRERTQKDTQEDKPEPEEPKPKLSPQEEYLEWLNSGGTAAKQEEKEKPKSDERSPEPTTLAVEAPPSVLPRGKPEPFSPEALTVE